jgi:hypothetical protein
MYAGNNRTGDYQKYLPQAEEIIKSIKWEN